LQSTPNEEGSILIVGNNYDHKDTLHTTDLLAKAFPYHSIVVLGPAASARPRVTVLESGKLSEPDMHRLYAAARAVVFPSFYEGFGFPIVTALAYGRTVLARRSQLLSEVAARCRSDGSVVPFDRREDLVELIGRLFHRQDVPKLPLGTAIENDHPNTWTDVSRNVLEFLVYLTTDLSRSRWRSRDNTIRQLTAVRV
jgi:glycosyltransferase involved in cell wall biosynthesis